MSTDVTERVVSFAGSSVQIDCRGVQAVEIVDFLYRDLPASEGPSPHVTLKLRVEPEQEKVILRNGRVVHYKGRSVGGVGVALLQQTLFHLADKSGGGLLLHAAAASWRGRAVLFPGKTGTGKSTLMSWLMTKGFDYLTDELVYVPFGSDNVDPFVRPLNIKSSAKGALAPAIIDFDALASQLMSSPSVTLVPRSALGQKGNVGSTPVGLIVFPTFQSTASFVFDALPRAATGMGLMSCLINARNLPDHGFPEATRLAKSVPGFRLEYSDFSQLEGWLDDLKASECLRQASPPQLVDNQDFIS
ncbi:MAG: hypothetical protein AB7F99_08595 [Vicinamibacterales bacterium]